MVQRSNRRSKQSGFTLVELLIVVAIIGVLSTIGVPTFKRMIQKSKKSEAKVNLGGLYTAEQAFFAEYNAYGNRPEKVGFQTDGSDLIYVIGFPKTAACDGGAVADVLPDKAAAGKVGEQINRVYSSYYAAATATETKGPLVAGNVTLTSGCASAAVAGAWDGVLGTSVTPNPYTGGAPAVGIFNARAGTDSDGFIATASGVIAPSVSRTAPAAGDTDVWAINSVRVLANVQDGVK